MSVADKQPRLLILPVVLATVAVIVATAVSLEASDIALVRWVDDGDTVVLADGRRVRYAGINTPEVAHKDKPAERLGPEARDFNRRLVFGKKVRLEFDREKYDQYGRLLAYVFLLDGTFVNGALVREGYAYFFFHPPNKKYERQLLGLQRQAMDNKAGMWKGFSGRQGPLIGNRRSRRFHRATCPFGKAISPQNRIDFRTECDAFRAGFSPCKKCSGIQ